MPGSIADPTARSPARAEVGFAMARDMLSAIYGGRPRRRPATGIEQLRATRPADRFAWPSSAPGHRASPNQPPPRGTRAPEGSVPALVRAAAAPAAPADAGRAGRLAIDWAALLAAGHPDPRSPMTRSLEELQRMAAALLRRAFAEQASARASSRSPAPGRARAGPSSRSARPIRVLGAQPPGSASAPRRA